MKVLVLGSGGREHALSYKIAQSSQMEKLFVAPGNPGTAEHAENVELDVNDFEAIGEFVLENEVDYVVVGPEGPLVNGISDYFGSRDDLSFVTVIGPNKEASQLEGSKDFAKKFMQRHNIPTAAYSTFTKDTLDEGYAFLDSIEAPYVLKADGLAAGKGVVILDDLKKAKSELKSMLGGKFGDASASVVIEEYLDGIELSVFLIVDGTDYKLLPEAKDYKRIGEGDTGLNTGGMGAISPVPFMDRELLERVTLRIINPTLRGLNEEGILYQGFMFLGLMVVKGEPFVIEYNVRMGDPETEAVMPRLKSDILELFEGIATGTLSERDVNIDPKTAATVIAVSEGYPENYEKGKTISGVQMVQNAMVFHAGTKEVNGMLETAGGRVLAITSLGKNIEDALKKSYEALGTIDYDGIYYRSDIGFDLIKTPSPA